MNYLNLNKSNKKVILISVVLAVALAIASLLVFNNLAHAVTNSEDKLYGESLTSRGMSVADCPSVSAQYSVMLSKNGTPIYERNAYDSTQIASLTKIMTAVVAMECSNLSDTLIVSKKAYEVGESSAGLWPGDELSIEKTLYAMLIPSGNDSAQAICEKVGQVLVDKKDDRIRKKSQEEVESEAAENNIDVDDVKDVYITDAEEAFIKLMNVKAQEIGCTNSNFTNPHGLADDDYFDPEQHSCAMDIGKITRYAMQYELFRNIVGGGAAEITVDRDGVLTPIKLSTTDALIGVFEGCIGVKTGNTLIGGPCFAGAYQDAEGDEIYTVVLKSQDETVRFIDTQDLFNWYIKNKTSLNLTENVKTQTMTLNDTSKTVGVVAKIAHSDWVDCLIPVTVRDQDKILPVLGVAGNARLKLDVQEVSGDFKAGDKVGELILTQHDKEIQKVDLFAVVDQLGPNPFQAIGVAFDRMFRSISGNNTVAQSQILANCDKVNEKNKKNTKQEK